ncbi:inverted formin-2-like [Arachis ipaensis]|uniref:inverted formin-2-like n=1 Tax=Arachis ipaensis TaxID=130454 RepID=UPI0007AF234C|nr:inverted formin-2-like [Arachis ipaensis]
MTSRAYVRTGDINRLNDIWHVAGVLDLERPRLLLPRRVTLGLPPPPILLPYIREVELGHARGQRAHRDGGDPPDADQQLSDEEAEYARQEEVHENVIPDAHAEHPSDAFFADHKADVASRLMPGTSADHPTDDRTLEQPQFDIRSDDMMDIDDMFEILGAPSHAMDALASHYLHRRDDTDIPGTSSSVSICHGTAPPGHYQTPPPPPHQSGSAPSPHFQTPSLPPPTPPSGTVWRSPRTPPPMTVSAPHPPMTVSAPPPPSYQRPPLTFSQPGVRSHPYCPPRVSRPRGSGTGHHLDPAAGRR